VDHLIDALAQFKRNGDLDPWDDRKIRGGQQWEERIIERAKKSRLFLLLITNRFVGSEFSVGTELTIARALYARRLAAIAPVHVEECNWEIDGLTDLQLIRPFDRTVSSSRKDRAWTEVGRAIKKIADDLCNGRYFPETSSEKEVPPMLPYSIGRDEEETYFRNALAAAAVDAPFVCVLSGSRQGQKQFIDRLAADGGSIRGLLGLTSAYNPVAIDGNRWIGSGEPAERMLDGALAPFVESIENHPGSTLVRFELTSAEWRACGQSRLNDFLRYWSAWPPLKPDRRVLVFVAIDADVEKLSAAGGFWLPLSPIARTGVEAWLRRRDIRGQFLTARIEPELPAVFGGYDVLRMDDLAEKLMPLLKKYHI
jgi:hypothetical protein